MAKPEVPVVIAFGFFRGLMLAALVAALLDLRSRRLIERSQVERMLGLPVLRELPTRRLCWRGPVAQRSCSGRARSAWSSLFVCRDSRQESRCLTVKPESGVSKAFPFPRIALHQGGRQKSRGASFTF